MIQVTWGFAVENKGQTPSLIQQVHGAGVHEIAGGDAGTTPEGDAVYTAEPGREVYVFTADCLPVLLVKNRGQGPVAAVHAGWRGAKAGIVRKTIETMGEGGHWQAILGPCIRACCFEVKDDFLTAFETARGPIAEFVSTRSGKTYFDLVRFVVERELAGIDIVETNPSRCTVCSSPTLPSYRRNGNTLTRIRAWIKKNA
jgi:YfiH family protein